MIFTCYPILLIAISLAGIDGYKMKRNIFSCAIRVFSLSWSCAKKWKRKSDLSLLLTSSFGVEAQYRWRMAPSMVSSGQNDCLVMGRRIQACQIEGTNMHHRAGNVVVTGYMQSAPFIVSILLRYKNSQTVAVWEIELLSRKWQTLKVIWKPTQILCYFKLI